ncbi:hypothetical protein [Marinobacterium litorale]|uniref:hypothetical protein n=1 Tax=Marinobacterium litorale TaxID=404770 RepID=UPI0004036B54|nr:hypothetical protein [Marinobacterium litorale]
MTAQLDSEIQDLKEALAQALTTLSITKHELAATQGLFRCYRDNVRHVLDLNDELKKSATYVLEDYRCAINCLEFEEEREEAMALADDLQDRLNAFN